MNMNRIKEAVAICLLTIFGMQTAALGQTGYSITDNNQDATNRRQQLYRINISNGDTSFIGDVVGPAGQRIIREYEGIASIGSTVYGVAEFAGLGGVGTDCNTGDDPITGLSSDLRTFKVFPAGGASPTFPSGPQQTVPSTGNPTPAQLGLGNGQNTLSNVSLQIGETCINTDDGGTEAGAGYNAVDGFLWSISSDDNFPATGVRSRLYRISPTTGLAQRMCTIGNADFATDGGDQFPYLDGMTILSSGAAFATEARFSVDPNGADADNRDFGGLYQIPLPASPVGGDGNGACESDFVKYLFPVDANLDTGLAHSGTTLFILLERGTIFQTNILPTGAVLFRAAMSTPGAVDGANGGDADGFGPGVVAEGRIEGCRGGDGAVAEFAAGGVGVCRDFEGFDIPVPAGR
jgi:hypothetical protein